MTADSFDAHQAAVAALPQHSWVWVRESAGAPERVGRLVSASPAMLGNAHTNLHLGGRDVFTPVTDVRPLTADEVYQAETYDWGILELEEAAAADPSATPQRSRARVGDPRAPQASWPDWYRQRFAATR